MSLISSETIFRIIVSSPLIIAVILAIIANNMPNENEKDKETRENLLHAGFVIFVSWLSVGLFVGFVCLIFLAYMLYYMKEPLRNTIVASLPGLPGIPVNQPVGRPVVPVVPVEIQLPRQVL
jgi:hypothetical protein